MIKVKFCPKCGSTEYELPSQNSQYMGVAPIFGKSGNSSIMECSKCKFVGIFPEVNKKDIPKIKKEIEKFMKKK